MCTILYVWISFHSGWFSGYSTHSAIYGRVLVAWCYQTYCICHNKWTELNSNQQTNLTVYYLIMNISTRGTQVTAIAKKYRRGILYGKNNCKFTTQTRVRFICHFITELPNETGISWRSLKLSDTSKFQSWLYSICLPQEARIDVNYIYFFVANGIKIVQHVDLCLFLI